MVEIPSKHLRDICKLGQGAKCCRFAIASDQGIVCCKGSNLEHAINARVALGKMIAQGDNCPGLLEKFDKEVEDEDWVWK